MTGRLTPEVSIDEREALIEELRKVRRRGLDVLRLEPLIERAELPGLLRLAAVSVDESLTNPHVAASRIASLVTRACNSLGDDSLRALAQALFMLHPATKDLSPTAARK